MPRVRHALSIVARLRSWFTRSPRAQRIDTALARIETQLAAQAIRLHLLNQRGESMAVDLSELRAAVAANNQVDASAITLLNGLSLKLSELIATSNNSVNPDDIRAIVEELNASTGSLASAITANTPSDPAAQPTS